MYSSESTQKAFWGATYNGRNGARERATEIIRLLNPLRDKFYFKYCFLNMVFYFTIFKQTIGDVITLYIISRII